MLIIYTTTSSKKEAKRLTQLFLQSRLIACVQRHKIKSSYEKPVANSIVDA